MVIYKITSKIKPAKIYIGSALIYKNRRWSHLTNLKSKKHKNIKLQNHFNKYGIDDLYFEVVETVASKDEILNREQYWIDKLNPWFNICKIAGNSLGVKRSLEYRIKMSNSKTGKKHRPECSIEKSLRMMGKQQNLGYKHTDEAKKNISKNHGRKRAVSQFDLDGNFIQDWDYIKLAADTLNIQKTGINMCCKNIIKQTGGFKFTYKN